MAQKSGWKSVIYVVDEIINQDYTNGMKKSKSLVVLSVAMVIAVVALIGVAGVNLSRTVGELEVAVTRTESDTVIAKVDHNVVTPSGDGMEYVAPLGENVVVEPDGSRILAVAVSAQGMVLGLLAVCLVVVISLAVRYWYRKGDQ